MDIGTLRMAQQNGGAPTTLAAGNAPAESGRAAIANIAQGFALLAR